MEKIKLNFFIKTEVLTAKEYINFCKKIILHLQSFDSLYKSLSVIDIHNKKNYFFDKGLSDFNSKNVKKIIIEEKDVAYKNSDLNDKELSKNSMSWAGFSSILFFGNNVDGENIPDISLNITQGSYEGIKSSIKIEYSEKNQDKLTQDYIFKLIKNLTQVVDVKFGNAITNELFRKLRQKRQFTIGWITYIKSQEIYNLLEYNIKKEKINQGVCFSLTENIPDEIDQKIIDKAIQIKQNLEKKDLLTL